MAGGVTRLMVTPTQHVTSATDLTTSTRRVFSDMQFRLFYSANTSSYCYLSAPFTLSAPNATPPACVPGFTLGTPALAAPPTITGVDSSWDASSYTLTLSAHVFGDPIAGIHAAWATWTIPPGAGQTGNWSSIPLTRDAADLTLYTGSVVLAEVNDPSVFNFMVQATNGIGRVSLDNNRGVLPARIDPGRHADRRRSATGPDGAPHQPGTTGFDHVRAGRPSLRR